MLENISWNKNKNKNHTMFRLPFINCFPSKKTYLEKITICVYLEQYKITKIQK